MSVPTEVIVAIITVFGGGIISLLLKLVSVISKVNEAVNEKHKRVDKDGNIPPKLFDIVLETNKLSKETRWDIIWYVRSSKTSKKSYPTTRIIFKCSRFTRVIIKIKDVI